MSKDIRWRGLSGLHAILASSEYRLVLAEATRATALADPANLVCSVSDDGWRYRPGDRPRPLYSLPSWSPQEDANWRWHHQQLALLGAYLRLHDAGDARAIPALVGLILDWHRNTAADPHFAWGEHTTPLRLVRLVRMFGLLFDEIDPALRETLVCLVSEHVDRLLHDPKIVRSHHNHALDQIFSLLLARCHFPFLPMPADELATRLAVERRHLLADGVVTENSPGYQSWIPGRIAACERMLTGASDAAMEAQALAFAAWVARPDGTFPEIGDTPPGKPVECILPGAPALPVPEGRFRLFPGYFIYRDCDDIHLVLKCGFRSHAHRHADDGSFVLSAYGEDWFVDTGMFGYAKGWQREHARSAQAHNISFREGTVVIGSTTSRRAQRHGSRWGIANLVVDGDAASVDCRSFMFEDATYLRTVSIKDRQITLADSFDKPGTIRTRFHVPANKTIKIEYGRVVLNGRIVLAHNLGAPRIVEGFRTVAYLQYEPVQAIEFEWPAAATSAIFTIDLQPGCR